MELSTTSQTLHNYLHKLNDEAVSIFDDACKNNEQFLPFFIEDFDHISSNDLDTTFHLDDSMGFNTSDLPVIYASSNIMRFQSLYTEESASVGIVFDFGASISISLFATDFVKWDTSSSLNNSLHGVSDCHYVQGVGTIKFCVINNDGKECFILTKGFYVPTSQVSLLITIRYIQHEGNGAPSVSMKITAIFLLVV